MVAFLVVISSVGWEQRSLSKPFDVCTASSGLLRASLGGVVEICTAGQLNTDASVDFLGWKREQCIQGLQISRSYMRLDSRQTYLNNAPSAFDRTRIRLAAKVKGPLKERT